MKKKILVLFTILMMGILTGCGMKEEEAKAYVEASLDAAYMGEFDAFVEITDSTPEGAAAMYDENIEHIMDAAGFADLNLDEELTEDYNAEDFKNYVKSKFYESVQTGETNYAFAMAAVHSIELMKKGEKPLEEAEWLVINSDSSEFLTGLYIFTLLGWCKYCSIEGPFATQTIVLSRAFEDRLRCLLRDKTKYLFRQRKIQSMF